MKRLLIFALFPFLFACGEDEKQEVVIPADVLPKEKMAMALADVHLAEAGAYLKTPLDSSAREKVGFQHIYERNQISKVQYDSSLSFYVDHPELLNEVYEIVLNELSRRQGAAAK
jgi:hypothetical protein